MTDNKIHYFIHVSALLAIFFKIFLELSLNRKCSRYLGPYDEVNINVNIDHTKLFDVDNFTYLLNSKVCENVAPLLIVIVSSSPKNLEERNAIRETWGRADDTLKLVFLVGLFTGDPEPIMKEHHFFGDIVQGSFMEAYRNMTYKHVMGLKWVTKYCSRARYVLKTDDDVMINISGLKYYLVRKMSPWGTKDLIAGDLQHKPWVPRVATKWVVGYDEYREEKYPNYCLGWAVVYSPDIIKKLLELVPTTKYFWIDDIYITGFVAKKLNVRHTSWEEYLYQGSLANLTDKMTATNTDPFLFGPFELFSHHIHTVWKAMPDHWIWNTNF